jgi:Spy/CpxP family protein refolding chaperone
MKKQTPLKLMTVIFAALFLSVLVVSQAFAFRGDHKGRGQFGFGKGMRALMDLDLTDAQKNRIAEIMDQYQPEIHMLKERIREARNLQETVAASEAFNEAQFRQTFKLMTPLLEDMAVLRAKMKNDITNELTSEQIDQLEENREKRRAKRQQRRQFRQAMRKVWLDTDTE